MHFGHYISGFAHLGLLTGLFIGPVFQKDVDPIEYSSVSLISEQDFIDLTASNVSPLVSEKTSTFNLAEQNDDKLNFTFNEESKVLKFGEFITEDVMKDLKKISKSKKDMEIKLSDGSEIPIDPMTAEIFVKYIEGLKSSEQKKVINQIQRTERGFMKVLGKAHGE